MYQNVVILVILFDIIKLNSQSGLHYYRHNFFFSSDSHDDKVKYLFKIQSMIA